MIGQNSHCSHIWNVLYERMRIIARATLVGFWAKHPATRRSLEHWHRLTEKGSWRTPLEITATFPKAKVLNAERVRFEVSGGDYRMIVAYRFDLQIAWIKFIGTHAAYDRIDAMTVSQY